MDIARGMKLLAVANAARKRIEELKAIDENHNGIADLTDLAAAGKEIEDGIQARDEQKIGHGILTVHDLVGPDIEKFAADLGLTLHL